VSSPLRPGPHPSAPTEAPDRLAGESRRRRAGPLAALAFAAALLAAGCGATAAPTAASARGGTAGEPALTGPVPLPGSVGTARGTFAVVAMGHLAQPLETFWQVFVLPGPGARWALRTPTGVADNGGLVVAARSGRTVVAIRPSQLLAFTPLAVTSDGGRSYTPGVLPGPIAATPAALAIGPGGVAAALSGGQVVVSGPGLAHWRVLTTLARLAASPAGRRCGLRSLTAVAETTAGVVVGGSCARVGTPGLVQLARSAAPLDPPAADLPSAVDAQRATVLRLAPDGRGLVAVLGFAGAGDEHVVTAWQSAPGRAWRFSTPETLTGTVVSTSVDSQGAAVVLSRDRTLAAAVVDPAGGTWHSLPTPPAGTQLVALSAGRVDALVASGTVMVDDRLDATGTGWVRAQLVRVAIDYGSSS